MIGNYCPDIMNIKDFITDKMQLRLFLLQEITDEIDGEEITCSRMEFCQKLYMRYLEKKYQWDQEKIDKHLEASEKGDLDGYARWLATTAWTKDRALENLFQDAVIRGFYHEIMTILGFLDSESPSERLANAKSNTRSSVRRSLDGSMDVLPVQFQPSNWFRTIKPNFSPKDMTLDPSYLTEQYRTKTTLLASLETQLRALLSNNITDSELATMENTLKEKEKKFNEASEKLAETYSSGVMNAMKLIVQMVVSGDVISYLATQLTAETLYDCISGTEFAKGLGLPEDVTVLQRLCSDVTDLYKENLDYFALYNEIVEAELEIAAAHSSNYDEEISILIRRAKTENPKSYLTKP